MNVSIPHTTVQPENGFPHTTALEWFNTAYILQYVCMYSQRTNFHCIVQPEKGSTHQKRSENGSALQKNCIEIGSQQKTASEGSPKQKTALHRNKKPARERLCTIKIALEQVFTTRTILKNEAPIQKKVQRTVVRYKPTASERFFAK